MNCEVDEFDYCYDAYEPMALDTVKEVIGVVKWFLGKCESTRDLLRRLGYDNESNKIDRIFCYSTTMMEVIKGLAQKIDSRTVELSKEAFDKIQNGEDCGEVMRIACEIYDNFVQTTMPEIFERFKRFCSAMEKELKAFVYQFTKMFPNFAEKVLYFFRVLQQYATDFPVKFINK